MILFYVRLYFIIKYVSKTKVLTRGDFMKKLRFLVGMIAMAAFIQGFTSCSQDPSQNPGNENPEYSDPNGSSGGNSGSNESGNGGEQKPSNVVKGKYFSAEPVDDGIKITLADEVTIEKDSGSSFYVDDIFFGINITNDDIDANRKVYVFPFTEKGKTYNIHLSAYSKSNWLDEVLECTAGGGTDYTKIFNLESIMQQTSFSVEYKEDDNFYGKLNTSLGKASDFILDSSALKDMSSSFIIVLGRQYYQNPSKWWVDGGKLHYLEKTFDSELTAAKNGFAFYTWKPLPTLKDWETYKFLYAGTISTSFILNKYEDTEYYISNLWSEQMRYVSSTHKSTMNIALNEYFPEIELATNHPWVNGEQDMTKVSNYERNLDLTELWEEDFPAKGDTVNISWNSVSDVDIKNVYCRLVENTEAVNWWNELCDFNAERPEPFIIVKDVKAGVPFQADISLKLTEAPVTGMSICIWYDVGDATPDGPANIKTVKTIDLDEYKPQIILETNHPWVDGNQDLTVVSNYQQVIEITNFWKNSLPKKGDLAYITWSAVSYVDVDVVYCRLIDNSSAANWWKELCEGDFNKPKDFILAKNIKKGVSFDGSLLLSFADEPIENVALCLWYDIGDANPEGPATFVLPENYVPPKEDLVLFESNDENGYEIDCTASYENFIYLTTPVQAESGYRIFHIIWRYEAENAVQSEVKLQGIEYAQSSTSITIPGSTKFVETSTTCLKGAVYDNWETDSNGNLFSTKMPCDDTVSRIQFAVQNSSYSPIEGKIFVKKAWLSSN